MKLSMRWLSDYLKLDVSIKEFIDRMTMTGSKVEGYVTEGEEIEKVVVGRIQSIVPHPNADKLVICQVEVGLEKPLQIVTGATNVFEGALVPVCLNGARLPDGTKIKTGKLRGELSEGMLCSLAELNVTKNDFPYAIEDGIFILQEECKPGDRIQDAIGLNDISVEFEITPNRPDCLSVLGLAREVSASFDLSMQYIAPVLKNEKEDIANYLHVSVQAPALCKRYMAKVVKNIQIKPSPRWMRERLRASGVRPINNLVDITNYVMLEYGQPMHAFDWQDVEKGNIVVRTANAEEKITTLEGVAHPLRPDMLVIADSVKPIAVAGVMGGEYSGIHEDTQTVVFESACFDGSSVRSTSRTLGLRTESSARFEKGLDPNGCLSALMRACELVEELGAGEVVGGMIDLFDGREENVRTVLFDPDWINQFLGISLKEEEMIKILNRLSFEVKDGKIFIPSFRMDVLEKADIAEEIARIYGYDKIPSDMIRGRAEASLTKDQQFRRDVDDIMRSIGCSEIYTYSFISPKLLRSIQLPADSPLLNAVTIRNPLGEETSMMRTTMLPSMLKALADNYKVRNQKAWLYEMGRVYLPQHGRELPNETDTLAIGLFGDGTSFYTIKGMVEAMLGGLHITDWDVQTAQEFPFLHPGRAAKVVKDSVILGTFGEVHPMVCQNFGLGTKTYVAEFSLPELQQVASGVPNYQPLPKHPSNLRDLCLICDESVLCADIVKTINQSMGKILERVTLFDVYQGEQIQEGKKSLSFSIEMRAADRTITDREADAAIEKILKNLREKNVYLRV